MNDVKKKDISTFLAKLKKKKNPVKVAPKTIFTIIMVSIV
jgi:hypothetical protein